MSYKFSKTNLWNRSVYIDWFPAPAPLATQPRIRRDGIGKQSNRYADSAAGIWRLIPNIQKWLLFTKYVQQLVYQCHANSVFNQLPVLSWQLYSASLCARPRSSLAISQTERSHDTVQRQPINTRQLDKRLTGGAFPWTIGNNRNTTRPLLRIVADENNVISVVGMAEYFRLSRYIWDAFQQILFSTRILWYYIY
jgi:hypothetical protein